MSLEEGKKLNKEWNEEDKLNFYINDCINIENNIKEIKSIYEKIEKSNSNKNIKISFIPEENNEIEIFLETIKNFGKIADNQSKRRKRIFDSKIVFDEEQVKLWLNNRKFKAELLFRKTENGSKSDDFHKYCDNKGITISFIETTKGYIFGGYTELEWEKRYINKKMVKLSFFLSTTKKNIQQNVSVMKLFVTTLVPYGLEQVEILTL